MKRFAKTFLTVTPWIIVIMMVLNHIGPVAHVFDVARQEVCKVDVFSSVMNAIDGWVSFGTVAIILGLVVALFWAIARRGRST